MIYIYEDDLYIIKFEKLLPYELDIYIKSTIYPFLIN